MKCTAWKNVLHTHAAVHGRRALLVPLPEAVSSACLPPPLRLPADLLHLYGSSSYRYLMGTSTASVYTPTIELY